MQLMLYLEQALEKQKYKKLSILKIRLSTDPRILTEIRWYQFLQFDITVAPPNWRVAVKRSIKIE